MRIPLSIYQLDDQVSEGFLPLIVEGKLSFTSLYLLLVRKMPSVYESRHLGMVIWENDWINLPFLY